MRNRNMRIEAAAGMKRVNGHTDIDTGELEQLRSMMMRVGPYDTFIAAFYAGVERGYNISKNQRRNKKNSNE